MYIYIHDESYPYVCVIGAIKVINLIATVLFPYDKS